MKKISIMLVAALMGSQLALAQEAQKPQTSSLGLMAVEVGIAPFSNSPFRLINGVRGRYFFSDKLAVRANLNLGYNSSSSHNFTTPGVTPAVEQITKNSLFSFSIAPGAEYHFATYEKASIYAGASLGVGFQKASAKVTNDGFVSGATRKVKGANMGGDRSGFSFDAQIFTGIDVYVYSNLYVGAELGLKYNLSRQSTVKTTTGSATVTTKDYGLTSDLKFEMLPVFRLGWKF
ncbi:MAG: hypothetical protein LBJ57_06855 [Prevotellaceae bacterium]|nr:hypothetical protein [Prevotellaceae bacterium]